MPRVASGLTARQVQTEKRPGLHADGGGLYLRVDGRNRRSWVFRFTAPSGARRDMGLGAVDVLPLAEAREEALDLRRQIRRGIDPLDARREAVAAGRTKREAVAQRWTFARAAAAYIAVHQDGWADKRAWPDSMRLYVDPVIGNMPVADIDTAAVLKVLQAMWTEKNKTATSVRGKVEAVIDWSVAHGHRPKGDNPARWRGHLDKLLPKPSRITRVEHHSALPYAEIPQFMVDLRKHEGIAAAALEFVVLTCARAGEVLGATWDEIDLGSRAWTVPAGRMKGGREHRSPLSSGALALLDRMAPFKRNSDAHVFLGQRFGRPMTSPTLLQCLGLVRAGVTVHGFRSSFRDWAAEQTDFPTEAAELALAHTVGSKVERAYRRSDLFDRRRDLAERWSTFCNGAAAGWPPDARRLPRVGSTDSLS